MKRLLTLALCMLLLCGCIAQKAPEPIGQTQTATEETQQTTQTTETEYAADRQAWLEKVRNPLDGAGMVPLLFVDTGLSSQTAFVICAGGDGAYYLSDLFQYNGEPLYKMKNDWAFDAPVGELSSEIVDFDRNICFTDFRGTSFVTKAKSLFADPEDTVSFIKIQAQLEQEAPVESTYYLGTYEDVAMFPADASYTDSTVTVDLDGDGTVDKVSVILTEKEYAEDPLFDFKGYYYDHKMIIERNGQTYTFEQYADDDQVAEGHDRVFVADVDLDGEYEIVRYEKRHLRFDGISIYDYNGAEYERAYYTISPQN